MNERKFSSMVIPPMIGHLTSLQTLPCFVVGEDMGHKIEELGSLKQLRGRLRIYNLMFVNDKEEAKKADIIGKKDMQELAFHFGLERSHTNHADVLEGLQPHKNLKGLILQEFGGQKFASWMTNANPQFLQNLVKIELRSCRACEQVPTLGHLPHLEVVEMEGLDNLKCIGPEFYGLDEGIVGCSRSSGAARSRVVFPALRKLSLHDMHKLEQWSDVSSLPVTATCEIKFFPCLKKLLISNCPQLITIPGQLLSIQSITILSRDCTRFESQMMDSPWLLMRVAPNSELIALFMEDLIGKSKSLRNLEIDGLEELHYLPNQLLSLTALEKLLIKRCSKLIYIIEETEITISIGLPSLQKLLIWSCNELRCLPKGLLQPTLAEFHIQWCESLECNESCCLTSLKKMSIIGCSNWKKLEALPEWLGNLSSLQSLQIWFCPNLMSLPTREAIQRLANLQHLFIFQCPILAERIQKGSGEEWRKIARIPLVEIDGMDGAPCTYRYSQKVPYQQSLANHVTLQNVHI